MDTPTYQQPQIDPATLSAEQTAQQDQIAALKTRTMSDSASLMAQYGILALASGGDTGPAAPAVTPYAGTGTTMSNAALFAAAGVRS